MSRTGSAAQTGLLEGLVIPSLLLVRGPLQGLLSRPEGSGHAARPLASGDSNSYWSQIELFQFAFVEEAFLDKVPNSSPAGTPIPGAWWRVSPVTLAAPSQAFSTHLAPPPGRARYTGLLAPLHPHREETGQGGGRGTEGPLI